MGDTSPDREAPPREANSGDFVLVAGKGCFLTHPLSKPEIRIGRERSCEIVIDDAIFSRHHALLRVGKVLTIEDLGSTNGVVLRGQRLARNTPVTMPCAPAARIRVTSRAIAESSLVS